MKTVLLILALTTVSCGKITTTGTSAVGGVRTLQSEAISISDHQTYDSICAAMTAKEGKLLTNAPNILTFDVVEKDCNGNNVTFGSQQVRTESTTNAGYQFRRQDTNGLFVFPSVETSGFGVMKELCGGATQMPSIRPAGQAVWVSASGFNVSDCPSVPNEQCIVVEYGSKQGTTDLYTIHTREFLRFNLLNTSGKYGYFTYRKSQTMGTCDLGKHTDSQATLR